MTLGVSMGESRALQALFPGPRRMVVGALFGEPERWWSVTELAGRAGMQPATLRKHLACLQQSGIIRERSGGCRAFQADPGSPVYTELCGIVRKLTADAEGVETILIVEDQPATAQITRILLESWGYRVLEARCTDEAKGLFERHGHQVHLLLTDVTMPGTNGEQLAAELQSLRPDLRVVFMSGSAADHLLDTSAAFLPKPFNPGSLSRMVRRVLDRRASARNRHATGQMKSS